MHDSKQHINPIEDLGGYHACLLVDHILNDDEEEMNKSSQIERETNVFSRMP